MGIANNQCFVTFKQKMSMAYTEKNYRSILERMLSQQTGQEMQLICELERAAAPKVKPKPKEDTPRKPDPSKAPDFENLNSADKAMLENAVSYFGDNFVNLPEE